MSQLIPAAPRAPQTAPAVQGAQRSAAPRSGDDFARALRKETGDRSPSTTRAEDRPSTRDDRSDVARTGRLDARRVDRAAQSDRAGSTRGTDRPGDTALTQTTTAAEAADAVAAVAGETPVQPVLTVPAGLVGILGVPGEAAAVTGAGDLSATTPASAVDAALTGAAPAQGGAPSAAAAVVGQPVPGVAALAQPTLGAPGGGAAAAGPTATPAVVLASTDQPAAGATAQATTRPGESLPVLPLVPTTPVPAAGAAPVLLAAVTTAQGAASGDATSGGTAGGAGHVPVAEAAAPAAGPAPAAHAAAFAQTLSGLTGVERATATAATGPTAQASLAEQVRGPVLALRTAAPGEHVLTLKVTPENLGPVQVRAHIGAEGIRIELVGATDAAREGLRNLLTDLRRDLAGTGMNASLSLGADSGTGGRAGQGAAADLGWNGDGSGRARSGPAAATTTREPLAVPTAPVTPTSSGAHGVDILT